MLYLDLHASLDKANEMLVSNLWLCVAHEAMKSLGLPVP